MSLRKAPGLTSGLPVNREQAETYTNTGDMWKEARAKLADILNRLDLL
jgi:hypothetical protein